MLHELLRQSLVLPVSNPNYRDITRGAIHILGVWILGNEEERPSFLRRSSSATSVTSHHSSDEPISEYTDANTFLRRYLLMIKLIFEEDKKLENRDAIAAGVQRIADWEGLVSLYKDAINVYRAITVSKSGMDIEWESW
jgi:hypothetical protein